MILRLIESLGLPLSQSTAVLLITIALGCTILVVFPGNRGRHRQHEASAPARPTDPRVTGAREPPRSPCCESILRHHEDPVSRSPEDSQLGGDQLGGAVYATPDSDLVPCSPAGGADLQLPFDSVAAASSSSSGSAELATGRAPRVMRRDLSQPQPCVLNNGKHPSSGSSDSRAAALPHLSPPTSTQLLEAPVAAAAQSPPPLPPPRHHQQQDKQQHLCHQPTQPPQQQPAHQHHWGQLSFTTTSTTTWSVPAGDDLDSAMRLGLLLPAGPLDSSRLADCDDMDRTASSILAGRSHAMPAASNSFLSELYDARSCQAAGSSCHLQSFPTDEWHAATRTTPPQSSDVGGTAQRGWQAQTPRARRPFDHAAGAAAATAPAKRTTEATVALGALGASGEAEWLSPMRRQQLPPALDTPLLWRKGAGSGGGSGGNVSPGVPGTDMAAGQVSLLMPSSTAGSGGLGHSAQPPRSTASAHSGPAAPGAALSDAAGPTAAAAAADAPRPSRMFCDTPGPATAAVPGGPELRPHPAFMSYHCQVGISEVPIGDGLAPAAPQRLSPHAPRPSQPPPGAGAATTRKAAAPVSSLCVRFAAELGADTMTLPVRGGPQPASAAAKSAANTGSPAGPACSPPPGPADTPPATPPRPPQLASSAPPTPTAEAPSNVEAVRTPSGAELPMDHHSDPGYAGGPSGSVLSGPVALSTAPSGVSAHATETTLPLSDGSRADTLDAGGTLSGRASGVGGSYRSVLSSYSASDGEERAARAPGATAGAAPASATTPLFPVVSDGGSATSDDDSMACGFSSGGAVSLTVEAPQPLQRALMAAAGAGGGTGAAAAASPFLTRSPPGQTQSQAPGVARARPSGGCRTGGAAGQPPSIHLGDLLRGAGQPTTGAPGGTSGGGCRSSVLYTSRCSSRVLSIKLEGAAAEAAVAGMGPGTEAASALGRRVATALLRNVPPGRLVRVSALTVHGCVQLLIRLKLGPAPPSVPQLPRYPDQDAGLHEAGVGDNEMTVAAAVMEELSRMALESPTPVSSLPSQGSTSLRDEPQLGLGGRMRGRGDGHGEEETASSMHGAGQGAEEDEGEGGAAAVLESWTMTVCLEGDDGSGRSLRRAFTTGSDAAWPLSPSAAVPPSSISAPVAAARALSIGSPSAVLLRRLPSTAEEESVMSAELTTTGGSVEVTMGFGPGQGGVASLLPPGWRELERQGGPAGSGGNGLQGLARIAAVIPEPAVLPLHSGPGTATAGDRSGSDDGDDSGAHHRVWLEVLYDSTDAPKLRRDAGIGGSSQEESVTPLRVVASIGPTVLYDETYEMDGTPYLSVDLPEHATSRQPPGSLSIFLLAKDPRVGGTSPGVLAASNELLVLPRDASLELAKHVTSVLRANSADDDAEEGGAGEGGLDAEGTASGDSRAAPPTGSETPEDGQHTVTLPGTARPRDAAKRCWLWTQHLQPLLSDMGYVLVAARDLRSWAATGPRVFAPGAEPREEVVGGSQAAGTAAVAAAVASAAMAWMELAEDVLAHCEAAGLAKCAALLQAVMWRDRIAGLSGVSGTMPAGEGAAAAPGENARAPGRRPGLGACRQADAGAASEAAVVAEVGRAVAPAPACDGVEMAEEQFGMARCWQRSGGRGEVPAGATTEPVSPHPLQSAPAVGHPEYGPTNHDARTPRRDSDGSGGRTPTGMTAVIEGFPLDEEGACEADEWWADPAGREAVRGAESSPFRTLSAVDTVEPDMQLHGYSERTFTLLLRAPPPPAQRHRRPPARYGSRGQVSDGAWKVCGVTRTGQAGADVAAVEPAGTPPAAKQSLGRRTGSISEPLPVPSFLMASGNMSAVYCNLPPVPASRASAAPPARKGLLGEGLGEEAAYGASAGARGSTVAAYADGPAEVAGTRPLAIHGVETFAAADHEAHQGGNCGDQHEIDVNTDNTVTDPLCANAGYMLSGGPSTTLGSDAGGAGGGRRSFDGRALPYGTSAGRLTGLPSGGVWPLQSTRSVGPPGNGLSGANITGGGPGGLLPRRASQSNWAGEQGLEPSRSLAHRPPGPDVGSGGGGSGLLARVGSQAAYVSCDLPAGFREVEVELLVSNVHAVKTSSGTELGSSAAGRAEAGLAGCPPVQPRRSLHGNESNGRPGLFAAAGSAAIAPGSLQVEVRPQPRGASGDAGEDSKGADLGPGGRSLTADAPEPLAGPWGGGGARNGADARSAAAGSVDVGIAAADIGLELREVPSGPLAGFQALRCCLLLQDLEVLQPAVPAATTRTANRRVPAAAAAWQPIAPARTLGPSAASSPGGQRAGHLHLPPGSVSSWVLAHDRMAPAVPEAAVQQGVVPVAETRGPGADGDCPREARGVSAGEGMTVAAREGGRGVGGSGAEGGQGGLTLPDPLARLQRLGFRPLNCKLLLRDAACAGGSAPRGATPGPTGPTTASASEYLGILATGGGTGGAGGSLGSRSHSRGTGRAAGSGRSRSPDTGPDGAGSDDPGGGSGSGGGGSSDDCSSHSSGCRGSPGDGSVPKQHEVQPLPDARATGAGPTALPADLPPGHHRPGGVAAHGATAGGGGPADHQGLGPGRVGGAAGGVGPSRLPAPPLRPERPAAPRGDADALVAAALALGYCDVTCTLLVKDDPPANPGPEEWMLDTSGGAGASSGWLFLTRPPPGAPTTGVATSPATAPPTPAAATTQPMATSTDSEPLMDAATATSTLAGVAARAPVSAAGTADPTISGAAGAGPSRPSTSDSAPQQDQAHPPPCHNHRHPQYRELRCGILLKVLGPCGTRGVAWAGGGGT